MEKVVIYCKKRYQKDVIHLLEENKYKVEVFENQENTILSLDLYDYQMNMLICLITQYMKSNHISFDHLSEDISIHQCHRIIFNVLGE